MRLPRFRIRTLMTAVAIVAVAMVPLSCVTVVCYTFLNATTAFNEAVAPFVALGATVTATGGDDAGRFAGAAGVRVIHCKDNFGDAELAKLAGRLATFPNLEVLIVSGPKVTDAGLAHLKGLKNLQSLSLRNTRVTDAGIADLALALPELKVSRLDLPGLR